MIPLKDDNPTSRAAVLTMLLIAANVVVFGWQVTHPRGMEWVVLAYGVIPVEVLTGTRVGPSGIVPPPFTTLSSMFLHGSVAHLLFNMLFLWIFGNNIEDALGRVRFVLFYLACGVAAALVQIVVSGPSDIPMVGASGAIAGVLGAYLVLYPHARVLTLVPIFIFIQFIWLPAGLFLAIWFIFQLVSSFGGGGGVAWYAHIGGFVAGVVLIKLLAPRVRPRRAARAVDWSDYRR
ncbi:MAG: rhomboid family intramembrane serine protease [Myxococcales bacterium]